MVETFARILKSDSVAKMPQREIGQLGWIDGALARRAGSPGPRLHRLQSAKVPRLHPSMSPSPLPLKDFPSPEGTLGQAVHPCRASSSHPSTQNMYPCKGLHGEERREATRLEPRDRVHSLSQRLWGQARQ